MLEKCEQPRTGGASRPAACVFVLLLSTALAACTPGGRVGNFSDPGPVEAEAFAAQVRSNTGATLDLVLASSVPLKGNKRGKWKGVDLDREPLTGRYAVFFHPFNTDPTISKPNGETEEEQFRPPSKQPADVDYKYTAARLDDNNDILTSCSPLDPRIRVL